MLQLALRYGRMALSINAAAQASRANYAPDAMVKAAEDIGTETGAKDWFVHERSNFMNAINEDLSTRTERPQRL